MLGHYRVIDKAGTGGMGEVYRARDEHLDREVAIKVLPPGTLSDESSRKRFHKEAITRCGVVVRSVRVIGRHPQLRPTMIETFGYRPTTSATGVLPPKINEVRDHSDF